MHMNNTLDNLIRERSPLIFKSTITSNLLRKLLMKLFKYKETTYITLYRILNITQAQIGST